MSSTSWCPRLSFPSFSTWQRIPLYRSMKLSCMTAAVHQSYCWQYRVFMVTLALHLDQLSLDSVVLTTGSFDVGRLWAGRTLPNLLSPSIWSFVLRPVLDLWGRILIVAFRRVVDCLTPGFLLTKVLGSSLCILTNGSRHVLLKQNLKYLVCLKYSITSQIEIASAFSLISSSSSNIILY